MSRPKSNLITASIVLGVLVLLVVGFFVYPFRSSKALQISFITITNHPVLGHIAVFRATNESDEYLSFTPCPSQIQTHGVWSKPTYNGIERMLHGHTAITFIVPVATNGELWRVPAWWYYNNSLKIEFIRGQIEANVYGNLQLLAQGHGLHFYNSSMGGSYTVFSSEITNTPSTQSIQ